MWEMASLSLHHDVALLVHTERLESARLERLAADVPRRGLGARLVGLLPRREQQEPAPVLRAYESRSTA